MATVLEGVATATNGASLSTTLPVGTSIGDVVFIVTASRDALNTCATPTDWELLESTAPQYVFARRRDTVWSMPTLTWSNGTGGAANRGAQAFSVSGLTAAGTVLDILTAEAEYTTVSGTGMVIPALTLSSGSNLFVVSFHTKNATATANGFSGASITAPAGWTVGGGGKAWDGNHVLTACLHQTQSGAASSISQTNVTFSADDETQNRRSSIFAFTTETADPAPDPENPPTGKIVVEVTSVPSAGTESLVLYASPDLAVGDFMVVDEVTTPGGYAVTLNGDGTYSYDAGGDESRQYIVINAWDTSESEYIGQSTLYINNEPPRWLAGGSDDYVNFSYGNSVAITEIDLYDYFFDYEDDTLSFTTTGTSTHLLSDVGLTRSDNLINGTTTTTDGEYLVTIRATDITGDYTEGTFRFAIDTYPYQTAQIIELDDESYNVDGLITGTITPVYEVPNSVTIDGVASTLEVGADEGNFEVYAPSLSDFLTGSWNGTPWYELVDLTIGFPGSDDVTTPVQFRGPAGGNVSGSAHWYGETTEASGIFAGLPVGTPWYAAVTDGLVESISDAGDIAGAYYAVTLYAFVSGAWTVELTSSRYEWPPSLPQAFDVSGYAEAQQSGFIRTTVDSGPELVRRRYSAVRTAVSGSMVLTETQWQTLMAFFNTTISGGSRTFYWNPTGRHLASPVQEYEMRFVSPPTRRSLGTRDLWQVDMQMEIMP